MPLKAQAKAPSSADRATLGAHPSPPHPFGETLTARDGQTARKVPHRALAEKDGVRVKTVEHLRTIIVRHHANPTALKRTAEQREAMKRLGLDAEQARL